MYLDNRALVRPTLDMQSVYQRLEEHGMKSSILQFCSTYLYERRPSR
jgi:hypothetical protein